MNIQVKTFIYLILLSGCVSPYEVDTVKNIGQIVITGKITNLKNQEPILIQATSTSGVRRPLTKAIVKVIENGTNEIVLIEELPAGIFFLPIRLENPEAFMS